MTKITLNTPTACTQFGKDVYLKTITLPTGTYTAKIDCRDRYDGVNVESEFFATIKTKGASYLLFLGNDLETDWFSISQTEKPYIIRK